MAKTSVNYDDHGNILSIGIDVLSDGNYRAYLELPIEDFNNPVELQKVKENFRVDTKTLNLIPRWSSVKLKPGKLNAYRLEMIGSGNYKTTLCIMKHSEGECCIIREYKPSEKQVATIRRSTIQRYCNDSFVIARISNEEHGTTEIPIWL